MTALRVGLTGGMASGKSTVATLLAERGCRVIDADDLVAELYRPGGEGTEVVRALFGEGVLTPSGAVDHGEVARRVFANPEARQQLERAIHPLVKKSFEQIASAAEGIVVLEATLLVEASYGPLFDLVVTVEADPEVRLRRAISRGMTEPEARARLTAQGDGTTRRAAAHRIIQNDDDLASLEAQIDDLVSDLHRLRDEKLR